MKIYPSHKIYVAKSTINGLGVFADRKIYEGEIIEETPIYDLGITNGETSHVMVDYRFNWPQGSGGDWKKQVVAWGCGSLYNHSETPNAYWRSNLERETFVFIANRDIEEGEEIFVWYGNVEYWQDGRSNIKVI